jgi:hypothetical protein
MHGLVDPVDLLAKLGQRGRGWVIDTAKNGWDGSRERRRIAVD